MSDSKGDKFDRHGSGHEIVREISCGSGHERVSKSGPGPNHERVIKIGRGPNHKRVSVSSHGSGHKRVSVSGRGSGHEIMSGRGPNHKIVSISGITKICHGAGHVSRKRSKCGSESHKIARNSCSFTFCQNTHQIYL
jgi:hypothetical protein